jgi:hypothetical protein
MSDKKWAVLVYISADNILANFAVESLKQLKRAATDKVSVVAQVDANGSIPAQRYFFNGDGALTSLADSKPEAVYPPPGTGTPDPQNLTDFIDLATDKYPDRHYALFLWGHGVELLLDEDLPAGDLQSANGKKAANQPIRRYLTPSNLKRALASTKLAKESNKESNSSKETKKLDIIGLDACSMSMIEIASEIQGYVDYMVASQEDVPDTSFPYEQILAKMDTAASPEEVSKAIPELYRQTFGDYVATPGTGVRGITLSTINLNKVDGITKALKNLSEALSAGARDEKVRVSIRDARREAKGFVFGLFVDMVDFCKQLQSKNIMISGLGTACDEIRTAIEGREIVIQNQVQMVGDRCHGISLYLPYRTEDATEDLQEVRAKGDTHRPLKGDTHRPLKERSVRIAEMEEDFSALPSFDGTKWNEFIKRGWSFILGSAEPEELDDHYSGEQCAKNLALVLDAFWKSNVGGGGATILEIRPPTPEPLAINQ